jgi:hypothetical protein
LLVARAALETERVELGPVAEKTVGARPGVLRAGDRRDAGVPERVEVPHRHAGAADVVGGDVRRVLADDVEVDADQRDPRLEQLLDLRVAAVDAHQGDAVDAVVAGAADVRMRLPIARPGLLRREQEHVVAERADSALEPDEDLLEERVADVRVLEAREEHDAQELRPLADERPRRRAGRVVELAGGGEDALARHRTHVVVPVEDAGDGGDRHPAELRDLPDRADRRPPSRKRFRSRR